LLIIDYCLNVKRYEQNSKLFERKKRTSSIYIVPPAIHICIARNRDEILQDNGADMIELECHTAIRLADGPVIQASSAKAIANGMTINKMLEH